MRPNTPTINTSRTEINVTSPPQTPTTGSPTFLRKTGSGPNGRAGARGQPPHASIIPPSGGVGSQFSSARGIRPEQISPRPSDSSEDDGGDDDDDDDDEESELSVSPPQSPISDVHGVPAGRSHTRTHIVVEATFEIEECSDDDDDDAMESDDDDDEQLEVLRPDGIEYADSEREVDPQLMNSLLDMKTCFNSDDESDDLHEEEFTRQIKKWRRQKKERRMNTGSISKRTISERGSDSDREDLQPWDTGDNNLRRLRRKIDRRSLLSIQPEIIIELKEPNSDGEVVWDEHEIDLARELPFWTMEVDVESD